MTHHFHLAFDGLSIISRLQAEEVLQQKPMTSVMDLKCEMRRVNHF